MSQARHPEEFVERVRVLWMQQPTIACREIARMLNVTRNIVIGLAHRQEWPGRPSPIKRRAEGEMPKPSRLVPTPKPATLPPLPSVGAAKLAPAKPGMPVRTSCSHVAKRRKSRGHHRSSAMCPWRWARSTATITGVCAGRRRRQ